MLVDTNRRDMTVEIFGQKLKNPFIFAPVGINKIYHPLGELIPARVAGEMEMGYMLSTAASQSIEDVASSNGEGSPRFFQLYMGHDDDVTVSLLERAHKAGFTACILTLDTWQLAWRPTDIDIANYTFYVRILLLTLSLDIGHGLMHLYSMPDKEHQGTKWEKVTLSLLKSTATSSRKIRVSGWMDMSGTARLTTGIRFRG